MMILIQIKRITYGTIFLAGQLPSGHEEDGREEFYYWILVKHTQAVTAGHHPAAAPYFITFNFPGTSSFISY